MDHILIIEDQEDVRQELTQLLENAFYQVSAITDFTGVAPQILSIRPDLVLLDMNLPGENGVSICMKLRKVSELPIIFVTGNNTAMDELNCIMQGGDDYISKPYQAPILLARIAAVLKRTKGITGRPAPPAVHKGVSLDIAGGIIEKNGRKAELTKNEMKILHFLFQNQGKIVPRADLINYLWDNEIFIDDNTLSVNITRLRTRLTEIEAGDFIETKRGMGYKV